MKNKQLISDVFFIKPTLEESSGNILKFKGVFQRADTLNENGRIYPKKVLEKAIEKFKKKVQEGRAVGTLEHPADGRTKAYEISHRITDIYINEQGEVIGEGIVLETTKGKELRALLEGGVAIGISSRGFGTLKSVNKDGKTIQEVQDDYELETFDIVYDPSTPGAFVGVAESIEEGDTTMEKTYTKQDFEKFAKEFVETVQEAVEKITVELEEEFQEKLNEEKEKLLKENPDAKIMMALTAIAKVLEPVVPQIAESMEVANEKQLEDLQKELEEAKAEKERLELENYKLQKIAESHEPEKLKAVLEEAKTKEEVDKAIEEYKKKKLLEGNAKPSGKHIDETSINRQRFFSRFTGKTFIGGNR